MKTKHNATLGACALAAMVAVSSSVNAQNLTPNFSYFNWVGGDPRMSAKCPAMHYHIVAKTRNQLEGVAFTSGQDPMELYTVSATISSDEKVTMDLKPVGPGTAARVEGTYRMGMLMLRTTSGSCHVDEFMLMRIVPPGNRQIP